ncbi:MAG: Chromate resistance protein ChrB [Chloroflexota bacterium]
MHPDRWLVLIYTIPSEPSRKRAYVWRELKRLGATYLRDGVALLPDVRETSERLGVMARRIQEEGGSADVVPATFPTARRDELIGHFEEERSAEYHEAYHAAVRFLNDVLADITAEDFGFPDVHKLESELGRLHRWKEQIAERDYFPVAGRDRLQQVLAKCDTAFEHFVATASEREDVPALAEAAAEDVFKALAGPPPGTTDLPL